MSTQRKQRRQEWCSHEIARAAATTAGTAARIITALTVSVSCAGTLLGQSAVVHPRQQAALGSATGRMWEPALAASPDMVMMVCHSVGDGIRYAILDPATMSWVEEGVVPSGQASAGIHDPSIVRRVLCLLPRL